MQTIEGKIEGHKYGQRRAPEIFRNLEQQSALLKGKLIATDGNNKVRQYHVTNYKSNRFHDALDICAAARKLETLPSLDSNLAGYASLIDSVANYLKIHGEQNAREFFSSHI